MLDAKLKELWIKTTKQRIQKYDPINKWYYTTQNNTW